ncbi:MAG: hypothetical protein A2X36_06265 [Elusimicrobia bacterium GWA2_69_24]|nr:MAG: hypothetical protein A2X36_06265 [Elusimicrobia bacterium GWA2_69_24]
MGQGPDPAKAAVCAVRTAKRSVPKPDLAVVFGSIHCDPKKVHRALCRELDPGIIVGGTSYAEISPLGVTKKSVAVLLCSFDGAPVSFASAEAGPDSRATGLELARTIAPSAGGRTGRPGDDGPLAIARAPSAGGRIPVGLFFSSIASGRENDALRALDETLRVPVFGGLCCGDYDLGMSHPDFWTNYQFCGGQLTRHGSRLALLDLPAPEYRLAFGYEHGWQPVGPVVRLTRCEQDKVYEVDGQPVFDYYRQFLGPDHAGDFFESLVQRYGFSLLVDEGRRSLVKLPVACDFKKGCISYFPAEDLQGRTARLIQASRKGLLEGAREAAERCRKALGGRQADLVFVVSCCARSAILHSKTGNEVDVIREVFGRDVPVFGYYSGGEAAPCLSRYEEVMEPGRELSGSYYHTTTVCLMALSAKHVDQAAGPCAPPASQRLSKDSEIARLKGLLSRSEDIQDNTESFLSNLSRKSYRDGERLRKQSEVIHRYTPHEVWNEVGANVARGQFEIADSEFKGVFLFMDVKGFTSYSEEHGPADVVRALNEIFKPATEIIYACGGDVDKYIGDCIFAAFRDEGKALDAGRRLLELSGGLAAQGNPFTVRIGMNAGRAVRANVGSQDRREYTFIGDAVNLAQRLESNCTPGKLLISESLYRKAKSRFGSAERREITVKGKKQPVAAYECSL